MPNTDEPITGVYVSHLAQGQHPDERYARTIYGLARDYSYNTETGYLTLLRADQSRLAVFAPGHWRHVEFMHGYEKAAWVKGGGPGCGCGCQDATEDPAEQSEGSTFTWPYDPTSGTVSTDDAVEQAKHEAADHILQARVDEAKQAVREAMRHLALVRAEQLADEQGDAA